uniref:Putative insulin growth factor binding protein n=1 Tax=Ixodes ricinus TaxID=34613 RepID=A0A0K8RHT2_IXORI
MNNYIIQHAKHIHSKTLPDKNKKGSNLFGRFNISAYPILFQSYTPILLLMVRVIMWGGCTWGRNTCTLGSLEDVCIWIIQLALVAILANILVKYDAGGIGALVTDVTATARPLVGATCAADGIAVLVGAVYVCTNRWAR